jgi:hypothetical protein
MEGGELYISGVKNLTFRGGYIHGALVDVWNSSVASFECNGLWSVAANRYNGNGGASGYHYWCLNTP